MATILDTGRGLFGCTLVELDILLVLNTNTGNYMFSFFTESRVLSSMCGCSAGALPHIRLF